MYAPRPHKRESAYLIVPYTTVESLLQAQFSRFMMEKYEIIDLKNHDRQEYFQYFLSVGTVIEFTVKIDVSKVVDKCKSENISFHAYMIFLLYKAFNSVDNFKYDFIDNRFIQWEKVVPAYSGFNNDKKLFCTLYSDIADNFTEYDKRYKETISYFCDTISIVPQENLPPNVFNVSCIPWLHYEHFSSNTQLQSNKIVKMITFGKYEKSDERYFLPLTLQISHAIADGYHVSQFFENLQSILNKS